MIQEWCLVLLKRFVKIMVNEVRTASLMVMGEVA